jgi:adenylate cyclase
VSVDGISLSDLRRSFHGGVPSVIATASADGTPNVTYLSTVHLVGNDRVALSNQFFSKTTRNLAENPRASVLVVDPITYDEHRLQLVFERTERRGPLFESLREEVDAVAALSGMQDVFRLRAADIYRVVRIEKVPGGATRRGEPDLPVPAPLDAATTASRLAELAARLGRAPDLDALVGSTVSGLAELLGYEHSMLALRDEVTGDLYVIASHGYASEGVGSELAVGQGPIGLAAERSAPVRVGALQQLAKYGRSVRRSYEEGGVGVSREVPLPSLPDGQSVVAVPAMAMGQLVGVLAVESTRPVAFDETDVQLLSVVATLVANAIETDRARELAADSTAPAVAAPHALDASGPRARVRFFDQDGSVATTSSRAWPGASCGRSCGAAGRRAGWSSPIGSSGSIRRSGCPSTGPTSRADSSSSSGVSTSATPRSGSRSADAGACVWCSPARWSWSPPTHPADVRWPDRDSRRMHAGVHARARTGLGEEPGLSPHLPHVQPGTRPRTRAFAALVTVPTGTVQPVTSQMTSPAWARW